MGYSRFQPFAVDFTRRERHKQGPSLALSSRPATSHPNNAINRIGCNLYISSHPSFFLHSLILPPLHTHYLLRFISLVFCVFAVPGLDIEAELSVLTLLTQDSSVPREPQQTKKIKRRDTELDPLILAAAFASGPHVTRHHYSHDFFPAVGDPRAEGAWDWTKWTGEDASSVKQDPKRRSYNSQQAPRRQRLNALGLPVDPQPQVEIVTSPTELRSPSLQAENRSLRQSIDRILSRRRINC